MKRKTLSFPIPVIRLGMGIFLLLLSVAAQARSRQLFDQGWLFLLGDDSRMSEPSYDDQQWRQLDLPHDWAIEGDFSTVNPSGANGGALPGGIGWYRKHVRLGKIDEATRYELAFDGVYMNASVYVNGNLVGQRPYGYSSVVYDITSALKPYSDNVIAVKVDNSDQPNSRWYSGCGIYRHVWLTECNRLHIAPWGTHVETTAKGDVVVTLQLADGALQGEKPVYRNTIYDGQGKVVARLQSGSLQQKLRVRRPELWSIDHPTVYQVVSEVLVDGKVVDAQTTMTGFRDFRFDAQTGFWLNGKNLKINGVCEHHDLGALGAAFNEDAMHRKLVKLKEMGVNAIRCSHNPPAPELLNLCDTMGFIVMDESFDMWRRRKTQNDYARYFDEWHERDLTDLVVRDRNHPCIVMWSIGNEVLEQWSSADADALTLEQANLLLNAGHDASTLAHGKELSPNSLLALHLATIVRKYDTTRPITAGCNEPSPDNHLFKSGALDIIGFNYHHENVKDVPKNFPGKPFLLSESVSALQTRGFYRMPSDSIYIMPERWDRPYTDPSMMCSAYDNSHAPWSSTHEETWDVVKHSPFCAGQFIWTGFDYIGEPTPYGFPARSSYFGVIDLAGMPKDVYYMYQSEWTTKPLLHLFPLWNWMKGETIDMWCYYQGADEVELFINGKSQGVRRKENDHQYHVMWRVTFEPGEVRAVARKNGKVVMEQQIATAGQPSAIQLTMDYDGRKYHTGVAGQSVRNHLVYVEADIVDNKGNLCPRAENDIQFEVEGGEIVGVDNGCPFSMERFKASHRKAFMGKAMLTIRVDEHAQLRVKARSVDLNDTEQTF